MSYMLEFPPRPLPSKVNSPPYVLFGIKGEECVSDLPEKIALNLVLHFAPKLKDWLLPEPTELPKEGVNIGLLTPYIGIDIQHPNVTVEGLSWILNKMLQLSGRSVPSSTFMSKTPSLSTCVAIHRTWTALELPYPGLDALRIHILMRMMSGPAVTLTVMRIIWDTFDNSNNIVCEMACNYMRAHSQMLYSGDEHTAIREWIKETEERSNLFKGWEVRVPAFGARVGAERKRAGHKENVGGDGQEVSEKDDGVKIPMLPEILEKDGTRRVSSRERKARHREDADALQKRLSRVNSNESLRSVDTVIWDPPKAITGEDGAAKIFDPPPKVHKKNEGAVSASLLAEKLSRLLLLTPDSLDQEDEEEEQ